MKKLQSSFLVLFLISQVTAQIYEDSNSGDVGIGTTEPQEKLEVAGNILLDNYFKFIQKGSRATLEHIITSNGQGGGLMFNAQYSGSGNPQGNATFTVDPGSYNPSAGYLDFDGNGSRWSLFMSEATDGIDQVVTFKELAYFDLDDGIKLSPTGDEADFFIGLDGNIGIGTNNPSDALQIDGDLGGDGVTVSSSSGAGLILDRAQTSNNAHLNFSTSGVVFANFGADNDGTSNLYWGDDRDFTTKYMTLKEGGNVGIGVEDPGEKLEINGNILLNGDHKFIQKRSNASLETIITGNGRGGGLMFNAQYSGSGNPQSNATFTVDPDSYTPSAGYLDFDGNSRRWSLFMSEATNGIYQAVTFNELAYFDLNDGIKLSPTGDEADFFIGLDGNVGIGVTNPDAKLVVDGRIRGEEIKVEIINGTGPDYVFDSDYKLRTLRETQAFIIKNKHLPEIPSAIEMEAEGIELGDMNMRLLKKIEELTLYQIELLEKIELQNEVLEEQQKRIDNLERRVRE